MSDIFPSRKFSWQSPDLKLRGCLSHSSQKRRSIEETQARRWLPRFLRTVRSSRESFHRDIIAVNTYSAKNCVSRVCSFVYYSIGSSSNIFGNFPIFLSSQNPVPCFSLANEKGAGDKKGKRTGREFLLVFVPAPTVFVLDPSAFTLLQMSFASSVLRFFLIPFSSRISYTESQNTQRICFYGHLRLTFQVEQFYITLEVY